MNDIDISGYQYSQSGFGHAHDYLLPTIFDLLKGLNLPTLERRIFELGCGNGSVAKELSRRGWDMTGVDPSKQGIQKAQDAFPQTVQFYPVLRTLQALALGRRGVDLQPGLDGGVLGIGLIEVGHQILHHRHMGQRIDLHLLLHFADVFGAGQRVCAVDVHGARAANTLAAGTPEGQGRIDIILDLDERIQDHGPAFIDIDLVAVDSRCFVVIGIPAIDLKGLHIARPARRRIPGPKR